MSLACRLIGHRWHHRWLDARPWSDGLLYHRLLGWLCSKCGATVIEHRWAFTRHAGAITAPEDK